MLAEEVFFEGLQFVFLQLLLRSHSLQEGILLRFEQKLKELHVPVHEERHYFVSAQVIHVSHHSYCVEDVILEAAYQIALQRHILLANRRVKGLLRVALLHELLLQTDGEIIQLVLHHQVLLGLLNLKKDVEEKQLCKGFGGLGREEALDLHELGVDLSEGGEVGEEFCFGQKKGALGTRADSDPQVLGLLVLIVVLAVRNHYVFGVEFLLELVGAEVDFEGGVFQLAVNVLFPSLENGVNEEKVQFRLVFLEKALLLFIEGVVEFPHSLKQLPLLQKLSVNGLLEGE